MRRSTKIFVSFEGARAPQTTKQNTCNPIQREKRKNQKADLTQHKRLDTRNTTAFRFDTRHFLEKQTQLSKEQSDVAATENLGDKRAARREHVRGDVERRQQQLRLHKLVDVVHAGHVGCTVAHHQLGFASVKMSDDLRRCRLFGNVAHNLHHAFQRRHRLQIDRHDFRFVATTLN